MDRRKRKRVNEPPLPEPPNDAVFEAISVVRCTLRNIVKDTTALNTLRRWVVVIAKLRKRVSMLAKELVLAMLEAGGPIPKLDQSFFSNLSTSIRNGKWAHHGHDELLQKHKWTDIDPEVSRSFLCQAMSLCARKMAAELNTHYEEHYDRFYARWKKEFEPDDDIFADSDGADLLSKIRNAWRMRRDLENANRRGFALLPEANLDVGYATLDAWCIACFYKSLNPSTCKGKTKSDLVHDMRNEVFGALFDMRRLDGMRGDAYHFRYSLQTDGYGAAVSFGRWVHYSKKDEATRNKKKQRAEEVDVADLVPGFSYTTNGKRLNAVDELKGTTLRAVDPGVHRAYTSVDLLTGNGDVRKTKMSLRSAAWRRKTKATKFGEKQRRWHEEALGDVQRSLNAVAHRNTSYPDRYAAYVAGVYEHWNEQWRFYELLKRRKLRFRTKTIAQRELDRETNRLTKPRAGDTKTILAFGDAASRNLFGRVKRCVKGPAKKLHDHVVRTKKAVVIWADEHRTSKLDVCGRKLVHPMERRADRLRPRPCAAANHAVDAAGCRCFCSKAGCTEKRTVGTRCGHHRHKVQQHDVCYDSEGRMWNRDVVAAINVGCLFLARALGLSAGPWERTEQITTSRSWAEIFAAKDIAAPFSLPAIVPT